LPNGAISGVIQIGSSSASIASRAGGSLSSELLDGKTVLKLVSSRIEDMKGDSSEPTRFLGCCEDGGA
jgi:hypothetical protein